MFSHIYILVSADLGSFPDTAVEKIHIPLVGMVRDRSHNNVNLEKCNAVSKTWTIVLIS